MSHLGECKQIEEIGFTEYCEFTRTTAIYPGALEGGLPELAYLSLGLAGEAGEIAEKMSKVWSGDATPIEAEMGDVYWYLVRLTDALQANPVRLDAYAKIPAIEGLTWTRLTRCALLLSANAGEIANKVKKLMRDGDSVGRREKIVDLLPSVYGIMSMMADELKVSQFAILAANKAKLTSRKERGKLSGDGDNR